MSTSTASAERLRHAIGGLPTAYRAFALAGAAVLTGTYLAVLLHVIDVVGGPGGVEVFVLEVAIVLAVSLTVGATLSLRHALLLSLVLLATGLGGYLLAIPEGGLDLARQLRDTIGLMTGLSVLRMVKAGLWALGFTPGPLFFSSYLFVRRRYVGGVTVGGAALAFFISTGDVGPVHGLVGALGAVAAVGFGQLDREAGSRVQRDNLIVLLIAILVVTTSVSLVPGGEARPLLPGAGGATVESSLVNTDESIQVLGSISLSPTVRFTVTAERPARWRVGAFDRYTGDGWVRAGQPQPYSRERLGFPEGDEITRLRQTYEVQSATSVMPAAWKPTRVGAGAEKTLVTSMGGLQPIGGFSAGEQYSVESHRDRPSSMELRAAGRDYPQDIEERYTQLPESTPARVGEFTARLTAQADNPYDTARVIEQWLEANKQYSLQVDRPDGDVAAAFIFQMDRGYCVYYATAMVTMLRSQGIPARFVVGYTTGEQVTENRWVVRGLDSHAWVEVYFPHQGWVAFDPTPAGPRLAAETDRLSAAREAGVENVDTDRTGGSDSTPTGSNDDVGLTASPPVGESAEGDPLTNGTPTVPAGLFGGSGGAVGQAGGTTGGSLPDEETVLYGLILLVGAATAAHRTGLLAWIRRQLWLRRRPDGPPGRRIEATFDRLVWLLGRRYRPKRGDETPREYLAAIRQRFTTGGNPASYGVPAALPEDQAGAGPYGGRLDRVFELHERAHYAGRAEPEDADLAWRILGELRDEWSLLNR